jgi:hypothetical protein
LPEISNLEKIMKKFLPFIFPVIAIIIVIFLAFRWYSSRVTDKVTDIFIADDEGVIIENLTQSESDKLRKIASGIGDFKTADLMGESEIQGKVRYEIKDNKAYLSIFANLPIYEEDEISYQSWVKSNNQDSWEKAEFLNFTKGGHIANLVVSQNKLPLEIAISKEMVNDNNIEEVLLKGIVE